MGRAGSRPPSAALSRREISLNRVIVTIVVPVGLLSASVSVTLAQTSTAPAPARQKSEAGPAVGEARQVKMRGTISAFDEKSTVTLEVGDPVAGTYVEAIAIEMKKAGSADVLEMVVRAEV